jgi:hypothetical protein
MAASQGAHSNLSCWGDPLEHGKALRTGRGGKEVEGEQGGPGAVYTMTTTPEGNEIVVYDRDAEGALALADLVGRHSLGSGEVARINPNDALYKARIAMSV